MKMLTEKDVICAIREYHSHSWIWIEIWEMFPYEIQLVVTVNKEELCHLAQHKVIHVCSAATDDADDISELKTFGKKIRSSIKKTFPDSHIHSSLRY